MADAITSDGMPSGAHPKIHPGIPPFPPESDDSAAWREWQEAVVEESICRPLGLDMTAKELIDNWESSYEFKSADNEIKSMLSTVCDFADGKISVEDAEKRIDDGSYRTMFFRDEYLKKGLQSAQEKEGQTALRH